MSGRTSPSQQMRSPVLITGASGFVGRALVERLATEGVPTRAAARGAALPPAGAQQVHSPNLGPDADWRAALVSVSCVVHLAARVHVMQDRAADPLTEFRRANVDGTLALAQQAAAAGVRRFVFVSSIKVNGEVTAPNTPFRSEDAAAPEDAYGISKWEAEQALRGLSADTGMELVIVRPVLVYGPGVKANFRNLMAWLARGWPLPLGAVHNRRSLLALDNLVDLLVTCVRHPAAAGQTFLASDGEDLSTTELLRRLGAALGKPARLLPVPASWLQGAARLLGGSGLAQRLCGSLQVDSGQTLDLLGWTPPVTVDDALRKTAQAFLAQR